MNPKYFMMGSGAVRLAATLFLVAISSHGMPPIGSLLVVAVVFGRMDAGFWPAAAKVKQDLVAPNQYLQANGSLMVAADPHKLWAPRWPGC